MATVLREAAREPNPELRTLVGARWREEPHREESSRVLRLLAWVQGTFYLLTGVWPAVYPASFVALTGPKVDLWLVKTVGLLIAVIGAVLLMAARRRRIGPELALLGAGSAAILGGVDLVYALSDVIADIYLLDAAVEIPFALLWLVAWLRRGSLPRT